jgi:hypothetical protein
MKKGNKEMLKTIISNQELIMKALKIEVPVKVVTKVPSKKAQPAKKAAVKKVAAKKSVSKVVKK